MIKAFWRTYYAIKHWRVFLPAKAEPSTAKPKKSNSTIVVKVTLALVFLVPVCVGLGFGYLAWTHGKRLERQQAVDTAGVQVLAKVEGTQIEEIRHASTKVAEAERYTPDASYFCHIGVSYTAPGSDIVLHQQFKFEDDTICKRYKIGDVITGKLLPQNPNGLILDEGRLHPFWFWISLLLFILFAVLPTILLVRGLMRQRSLKSGI